MNRREILKELRNLERGCVGCTKIPKTAKRDGQYTWCRENCPVMAEYAVIGKELVSDMEERRADRAIKRYRQENEMRPAAGTADLDEAIWNDLLATV